MTKWQRAKRRAIRRAHWHLPVCFVGYYFGLRRGGLGRKLAYLAALNMALGCFQVTVQRIRSTTAPAEE